MMRADAEGRSKFYASAIQNGWMTQNEVRALENMNPVADGDTIYDPTLNKTGADAAGQNTQDGTTETGDQGEPGAAGN